MSRPAAKVLVLGIGNSARSIIAEFLLRQKGKGRFETHSAGSKPIGKVNPLALWVLKAHFGIDASDARSKSWDEFRDVKFDFVITVCDHAKESCPIFPGQPVSAHFGSPDPAEFQGDEDLKKRVFIQVASEIAWRMELLCALPDEQLDLMRVRAIGESLPVEGERGPGNREAREGLPQ